MKQLTKVIPYHQSIDPVFRLMLIVGNVVFDFMTSDTKGDSTSTSAQELMLWLRYEGGQVPIGWSTGPVATITGLYGKTWKLYQGVNQDTGIMVSSLLVNPADQFYGRFQGDIKDWLLKMVDQGLFSTSTYVNVGNAGMEPCKSCSLPMAGYRLS